MNDTSFFTNEENNTLVDRFNVLLKDTEFFDCLVGYFYVSGFYKLQKSLQETEKIRILVGIGIDSQTFELIEDSKKRNLSTAELKEKVKEDLINEMDNSQNSSDVETGARQFIEWLQSGKLEIKAYKERTTHSKLYIMTFPEDDKDIGRVVTGSSNFTNPGLEKNLEFNVELRRDADYNFAHNKFEELWQNSVPISEEFIKTLTRHTWLRDDITPYELYLKFIYEFLYEKIWNDKREMEGEYYPPGFKRLNYQRDAVIDAKRIINEHGGVFLSDVVGLGKTYMGSLLAQQLKGTTLVIAPPALVDENNPAGWNRILRKFEVNFITYSTGKLDKVLTTYNSNEYQNVIIDESHEFRNEETQKYDYLSQICKGKKVILISATPFNNSPKDLLSQIKLFQPAHNSTIPNVRDLEGYFKNLDNKLKVVDRAENPEEYRKVSKEISKEIREDILQYLMVRRTRNSISKYYKKDLEMNNIDFPKVMKPQPIYYEFDDKINSIFDETLELITKNLTYAKYRPLAEEYQVNADAMYYNSQKMMGNFIKILLIKRLESGNYAFKKSIDNSIKSHEKVISTFKEKGEFYTGKNYNWKVYASIEDGDIDIVDDLIEKGKVKKYIKDDFKDAFLRDLESDLKILKHIRERWSEIEDYPKRSELANLLNSSNLKDKKIIIFTEFVDTANDIVKIISSDCGGKVKLYTGKSSNQDMQEVLSNFDANVEENNREDDYRILVATDTLSHGVNLHRSNVIINFDIPWNPTKIMQRVGRVQRLGTDFDKVYIYNFFPTDPIEENINIETLAKNKIAMFIELLGNDSQLLTDEPIQSFDLFNKLNSDDIGEDEFVDDELYYLHLMRDIRDNNKELFKKIDGIPKKARVGRKSENNYLISLLKTGKFKKIFKASDDLVEEIDFFEAVEELEATPQEKGISIDDKYYDFLDKNLIEFNKLLFNPDDEIKLSKNENFILKYVNVALANNEELSSYDLSFLIKVKDLIMDGHLTKNHSKSIKKTLEKNVTDVESTIHHLREKISEEMLNTETSSESSEEDIKEIVLSEYFV